MQPSRPAEKTNASPADLRRATWTCSLGSVLEYYDFALYNLTSAIIFGPLFFLNQEPGVALIANFGTYFLGLAVRPVGGILFGSLDNRLDRRFILSATVLLVRIVSTLIGVLPTYEIARIWMPIMLIALRLLQGLGTGAEQAGTTVLIAEYAPDGRRGYYAALPFLGIQIGTFMASVVYFILLHNMTNLAGTWRWRLPFFSSVMIIVVAIHIWLHLKEPPSFAKLEARQQVTESSLWNLPKTSRHDVFVGIGLRLAENSSSSIYQALTISYIASVVGLDKSIGILCLMPMVVVGAIMVPITGWLTDRLGRVPTCRSLAILQLLVTFPVWWSSSHGNVPVTIVSLSLALGVGAWDMFDAQGAFLPELFGVRRRYIGAVLAREVSAAIAEGIMPLAGSAIISWMVHTNSPSGIAAWMSIAVYPSLLTVGTIIATFFAPETRDRNLDDLASAEAISVPQHNQITGTYHDA